MKNKFLNLIPHSYAPFFRGVHIAVALLILFQIINSNFIDSEALSGMGAETVMTWIHVISGFLLLSLGFVLLAWMLTQRGFRWYYSWLLLDFKGIISDINTLSQLKLPDSTQGSIAATIQGLGVLSLIAVACSGGGWFIASSVLNLSFDVTNYYLHLHKFLTTFIEVYFYAHGAMGLLHVFLSRKLAA